MLSFKSKGSLGKTTVFVLFLAFSLGLTHSPAWASGNLTKLLEKLGKAKNEVQAKKIVEDIKVACEKAPGEVKTILGAVNGKSHSKSERLAKILEEDAALSAKYSESLALFKRANAQTHGADMAGEVVRTLSTFADRTSGDAYADAVISHYTPEKKSFLSYEELVKEHREFEKAIEKLRKNSDSNNADKLRSLEEKESFLRAIKENVFDVLAGVSGDAEKIENGGVPENTNIVMQFADLGKGDGKIENMVEVKFFKEGAPLEPIGVGSIELRRGNGKFPGVAAKDTWVARLEKGEKNNPVIDCLKKGAKVKQ